MSFLDLPAFVGFSLSALLHGSFDIVKFSVKFSAVAKKGDPFHLGLLLGPDEGFFRVANIRDMLLRLIMFYKLVSGDTDFYRMLFQSLIDVLCSESHPNSMTSWSSAYVFKWVSKKLSDFGGCLIAQKSSTLSKKKLFRAFTDSLSFNFVEERTAYLLSLDYQRMNAPRPPRYAGAGAGAGAGAVSLIAAPTATTGFPKASLNSPVPLAQQWCLPYASHAVGASFNPCKNGGTCPRVHPILTTPLTDQQKVKLRGLAKVIKPEAQKSKFLSAIA